MDNLDPLEVPVENIEIIDDDISFGTGGEVADTVIDIAPAEEIRLVEDNTLLDVAAPIAVGTVAPLAAAIVREEYRTEAVEETIDAPIAVVSEPEPVYTAPVVEPVHRARWPWALLALPLLAIPFLANANRAVTPVAEPVVVQTPVVREVVEVPEVKAPVVETPKVVAEAPTPEPVTIPTCNGEWITKDDAVVIAAPAAGATEVGSIAANTVLTLDGVGGDNADLYYEVTAGDVHGFVDDSFVVCQVAQARTTVTG